MHREKPQIPRSQRALAMRWPLQAPPPRWENGPEYWEQYEPPAPRLVCIETNPGPVSGDWKKIIKPARGLVGRSSVSYSTMHLVAHAREARIAELKNDQPLTLQEFIECCWDCDRLYPLKKVHKTRIATQMKDRQRLWWVELTSTSPGQWHLASATMHNPSNPNQRNLADIVEAITTANYV